MITRIQLQDIGPVAGLEADFGDRLNLVTGDNGLGKTFLLDACWYALTRTWADGRTILPGSETKKEDDPKISYSVVGKAGNEVESEARFDFQAQSWRGKAARPPIPGLVIYARIDGGFSVWDPARNYWRDSDEGGSRPASYQFSKADVWNGLVQSDDGEPPKTICNGLLRDVELWRLRQSAAFDRLQSVLARLSADESESLSIGEGVRLRVDDVVDIPTLNLPYGPVPVTMAAAGMKRVLALAYLLVWAWEEHRRSAEIRKGDTTDRIVLLFDEVEAHLHPKWQRVFLPALLEAVELLLLEGNTSSVQIIATTHAPLILGSVEASWKPEHDKLFDFDLVDRKVVFREREFARHGSAENWLSSDAFDLATGYPLAAEQAIQEADEFMLKYSEPAEAPAAAKTKVHLKLMDSLGGDDEYWPFWLPYFQYRDRPEEGQNFNPGFMAQ
jgi:hypothetical protein